jgi:hypothetical protein
MAKTETPRKPGRPPRSEEGPTVGRSFQLRPSILQVIEDFQQLHRLPSANVALEQIVEAWVKSQAK